MRVKNKRGILLWMDRKHVLGGSTGGSWNLRYGSGACLEFCSWVVKWERRGEEMQCRASDCLKHCIETFIRDTVPQLAHIVNESCCQNRYCGQNKHHCQVLMLTTTPVPATHPS
jgi:hypothetical protein